MNEESLLVDCEVGAAALFHFGWIKRGAWIPDDQRERFLLRFTCLLDPNTPATFQTPAATTQQQQDLTF